VGIVDIVIGSNDVAQVVAAARHLPPAEESYLETDFIMNLLETVLDYQMHTTAVVRALEHFREHRWDEIRTLDDLDAVFARYTHDQEGNTALAQYLWRYNMWTRAHQLRDLAAYFREIGVVDQDSLRRWAEQSQFRLDFEGKVKGLGIADRGASISMPMESPKARSAPDDAPIPPSCVTARSAPVRSRMLAAWKSSCTGATTCPAAAHSRKLRLIKPVLA